MKRLPALLLASCLVCCLRLKADNLAPFTQDLDIGAPSHPGSATLMNPTGGFLLHGGGGNVWSQSDSFHFLSRPIAGDLRLSAQVNWPQAGGNAHRKALLMLRASLDPDAPYVDVAQHGNGLASLQFRETTGGRTQEIQSRIANPSRIGLEKRGDYISFWIAAPGEALHPAGGSFKLSLPGTFYVGLGVCAHDDTTVEQARFSKVELQPLPPLRAGATGEVQSAMEIMDIASTDRSILFQTNANIQAPNWSLDNRLIFNGGGHLYEVGVTNDAHPALINIPNVASINNDHGISPAGTQMAISAGWPSKIYTGPLAGGLFKQITPSGPSYFHGWSPDGQTLTFCGQRNDNFDIYTIPVAGSSETRLTTAPGLDDGPEYSPAGRYIYFNSVRSGFMQIWRMKTDGSDQTQITPNDDHNNWFAHISPDGKNLVFLTFDHRVQPGDHPPNKDVMLRLLPLSGGPIVTLAKFFGGQGTINVASWSPDGKNIAFVSYTTIYAP